jgi:hypothetical protein
MNDRVDTLLRGRRERLQKLLLRPLSYPEADPDADSLTDEAREHLMGYADELYWNELEWENITSEEETGYGPISQLIFPGFLALVRGLLLEEALPDAKAPAEPRPEVVESILRFLAGRVVALEESLDGGGLEDRRRVEGELDVTDHLLDLVLYQFHDLSEAEIERLEEARGNTPAGN